MALTPERSTSSVGLIDVIDRILDKGLVIDADIQVSLVGTELLGVKVRAALASFETAARYGLEFPGGVQILDSPGWRAAQIGREACPACGKRSPTDELLNEGCPWCGWQSARVRKALAAPGSSRPAAGAPVSAAAGAGEEMTPAAVIAAFVSQGVPVEAEM